MATLVSNMLRVRMRDLLLNVIVIKRGVMKKKVGEFSTNQNLMLNVKVSLTPDLMNHKVPPLDHEQGQLVTYLIDSKVFHKS